MFTTTERDTILFDAQAFLGGLTKQIVDRESLGRSSCDDLYNLGYCIVVLIRTLTNDRLEDTLTTKQIDSLYNCLSGKVTSLDFPTPKLLTQLKRPSIIVGQIGPIGPIGATGAPGVDGGDNVKVITTDDGINVAFFVDGGDGKDTYDVTHDPYIAPIVSTGLDGGSIPDPDQNHVVEEGVIISVLPINITITKGRETVISAIFTPSALDPDFQTQLDLNEINTLGSQSFQIQAASVSVDTTYTTAADDGTTQPQNSDSLNFVFPFFDGDSVGTGINVYIDLNKRIVTQNDKLVPFSGLNKYFWFAYPASYGVLSQILDQNQFDVTAAWTLTVADVSSTGLDNNYVESYNIYRTTVATDINGSFTFNF